MVVLKGQHLGYYHLEMSRALKESVSRISTLERYGCLERTDCEKF